MRDDVAFYDRVRVEINQLRLQEAADGPDPLEFCTYVNIFSQWKKRKNINCYKC